MERNDQLIDDTIAYIRVNPDEWDQGLWGSQDDCCTTACFAGTALLLSGYTLKGSRFCDRDGNEVWPPDAARMELGLPHKHSTLFFHAVSNLNGIEGFDYVIDEIRAGRAESDKELDEICAELTRRHQVIESALIH